MAEDHTAIAEQLRKQAQAQLETNAPRAAAIASLAIVAVLVDIAESLREINDEVRNIGHEVCRDPGYHDHG